MATPFNRKIKTSACLQKGRKSIFTEENEGNEEPRGDPSSFRSFPSVKTVLMRSGYSRAVSAGDRAKILRDAILDLQPLRSQCRLVDAILKIIGQRGSRSRATMRRHELKHQLALLA